MAFDILFFPVELAVKYGQEEAVILNSLIYWIKKNKENNRHFYEGRTWTYNSGEAFGRQFPFWSRRQIERIMKSLITKNAIIKGNYNENPYDHTLWYALQDEAQFLGQYDSTKRWNRMNETVESTLHETVESTFPQTVKSNKIIKKPKIEQRGKLNLPVYISLCKKRDKGGALTTEEKNYLANYEQAVISGSETLTENSSQNAPDVVIETNQIMLQLHEALKQKLGEASYFSWFYNKILFINDDGKSLDLKVPTRFNKEYISQHFLKDLQEVVNIHFGNRIITLRVGALK